jgi:predicted dehydrogenase
MDQPVRVGIIGCGQIGTQHIATYKKNPAAKIVVFCDANLAAAEAAAASYGSGDVTSNYLDVLNRDDVDSVDVCLHNNFHAPITIAALKAGKHVYCEKPMAGSYTDAVAMMAAAKETGKKLHIQLATLYTNEARAAKELIDARELGQLYHARSTGFRRRGRPFVDGYGTSSFVQKKTASGGALYDMGVYHISQILYLLGNPDVKRISGKTYQKVAMEEGRRASSNYDVEEFAVGLVRFAGGLSMDLVESWAANADGFGPSMVLGDVAGVSLFPFGYFKNVGHLSFSATADLGSAGSRWNSLTETGPYFGESQAHWIAALQGKVELLPTAEIALNTMLISEGIYLSEKLDREVTSEEVQTSSVSTAVVI